MTEPRTLTRDELDRLIEQFRHHEVRGHGERVPYPVAGTAEADGARNRCASCTYAFHDLILTHLTHGCHASRVQHLGVTVSMISAAWETVDDWAGHRANVIVIDGTAVVLDWTFRQFDPEAAWPLITDVAGLLDRLPPGVEARDFFNAEPAIW